MGSSIRTEALATLARHLEQFPEERSELQTLHEQLLSDPAVFLRANMRGHVTASAAVLTPDGTRILLVDHKLLGVWLPPGGHYEGPGSLWQSACREVEEETGLTQPAPHPWTLTSGIPVQIASHRVPSNEKKGEGPHLHHDFRFLAQARGEEALAAQFDEVRDAQWQAVSVLRDAPDSVLHALHARLAFIRAV